MVSQDRKQDNALNIFFSNLLSEYKNYILSVTFFIVEKFELKVLVHHQVNLDVKLKFGLIKMIG